MILYYVNIRDLCDQNYNIVYIWLLAANKSYKYISEYEKENIRNVHNCANPHHIAFYVFIRSCGYHALLELLDIKLKKKIILSCTVNKRDEIIRTLIEILSVCWRGNYSENIHWNACLDFICWPKNMTINCYMENFGIKSKFSCIINCSNEKFIIISLMWYRWRCHVHQS